MFAIAGFANQKCVVCRTKYGCSFKIKSWLQTVCDGLLLSQAKLFREHSFCCKLLICCGFGQKTPEQLLRNPPKPPCAYIYAFFLYSGPGPVGFDPRPI